MTMVGMFVGLGIGVAVMAILDGLVRREVKKWTTIPPPIYDTDTLMIIGILIVPLIGAVLGEVLL